MQVTQVTQQHPCTTRRHPSLHSLSSANTNPRYPPSQKPCLTVPHSNRRASQIRMSIEMNRDNGWFRDTTAYALSHMLYRGKARAHTRLVLRTLLGTSPKYHVHPGHYGGRGRHGRVAGRVSVPLVEAVFSLGEGGRSMRCQVRAETVPRETQDGADGHGPRMTSVYLPTSNHPRVPTSLLTSVLWPRHLPSLDVQPVQPVQPRKYKQLDEHTALNVVRVRGQGRKSRRLLV